MHLNNQELSSRLREDTRLRIIDAAATEFSQDGFRASTLRRIALGARVNDITVFRHFPQKSDLYWEAIAWRLQQSEVAENLKLTIEREDGPTELLEGLISVIQSAIKADVTLPRLLQFTLLELDSEKQRLQKLYLEPLLASLTEKLKQWIIVGKLRSVQPEKAASVIVGVLLSHWTGVAGGNLSNDASIRTNAAEYAQLCFNGLSPTGPNSL